MKAICEFCRLYDGTHTRGCITQMQTPNQKEETE